MFYSQILTTRYKLWDKTEIKKRRRSIDIWKLRGDPKLKQKYSLGQQIDMFQNLGVKLRLTLIIGQKMKLTQRENHRTNFSKFDPTPI